MSNCRIENSPIALVEKPVFIAPDRGVLHTLAILLQTALQAYWTQTRQECCFLDAISRARIIRTPAVRHS